MLFTYHRSQSAKFVTTGLKIKITINNTLTTCNNDDTDTRETCNKSSTKSTKIKAKFQQQQHCFQNGIQNRSNAGFHMCAKGRSLASIKYEN